MSCLTVRTVLVDCTVQEVGWNFQPGTVALDTTALKVKVQPHLQHTSRSYFIHLGSFSFDNYWSICIIRLQLNHEKVIIFLSSCHESIFFLH